MAGHTRFKNNFCHLASLLHAVALAVLRDDYDMENIMVRFHSCLVLNCFGFQVLRFSSGCTLHTVRVSAVLVVYLLRHVDVLYGYNSMRPGVSSTYFLPRSDISLDSMLSYWMFRYMLHCVGVLHQSVLST